jgi:hypothetical protein
MLESVIANACAVTDPRACEPPPLVGVQTCVNGVSDALAARVLTGPSDDCHQRVVAQGRPQAGRTDSVDGSPKSPLSVLPTITAATQDPSPGSLGCGHVSARFSGDGMRWWGDDLGTSDGPGRWGRNGRWGWRG